MSRQITGILPQRSRRQIPDLRSQEPSESSEAEVMEDDLEPALEQVDPIPQVQIPEELQDSDLRRHLLPKYMDEIPVPAVLKRNEES